MKIAIDLDGIIANLDHEVMYRLKKFGIDIDEKTYVNRESYNIEECIDGVSDEWAIELFNDALLYQNAIAYEDAFYSISEWFHSGNDIYIITSRPTELTEVTLQWLDEWCIPYNQVYVGIKRLQKYKLAHALSCEVIIEDYPREAEVALANGISSFIVHRPYNANYVYGKFVPVIVHDLYGVTSRLVRNQDFKTRRNRESSFYR